MADTKGHGPTHVSFFAWLFGVPNKGTGCRAANPDHLCKRRWPTHVGRGQSRWRAGQPRLILLMCVFVVFLCVFHTVLLANWLVWTWSGTSQNHQLLCNQNMKSTTKLPKCDDMSSIIRFTGILTRLNILTEMQFWLRFDCTKSVVW